VNYTFWSFWFLIWHGREFDRLFIYQTGPLTNALSATLLKSIYRWKIIIWTQDLWPETVYAFGIKKTFYIETFLNALVKFIYRNCDEILVSCNGFIPRLKKLIHQGNFYWIPNWTLTDNYSTQKVELKGKFNFTFAGNVGKVQNLRNVLLAFKNISDKNPDVYFNVIGDGSYLLELKDIVDSNLIRNVVFHGQQPLNLMPSYYKSSDVLVLSLINEPLYQIMIPSKFQSYLNAKKPIFSIVNGELNNLVNDYNIGFTADSGEISSISNGFHSFIQLGSDQLKEMSVNSNILQTEYFDRSEVLKKLQNIVFK
jgi:glycosyltransferase involved in cell wall biosynthesis